MTAHAFVWIEKRSNPTHYRAWVDDRRYFPTYTSRFELERAREQLDYDRRRLAADSEIEMVCVLASYGNTVGRPRVFGLPMPCARKDRP